MRAVKRDSNKEATFKIPCIIYPPPRANMCGVYDTHKVGIDYTFGQLGLCVTSNAVGDFLNHVSGIFYEITTKRVTGPNIRCREETKISSRPFLSLFYV